MVKGNCVTRIVVPGAALRSAAKKVAGGENKKEAATESPLLFLFFISPCGISIAFPIDYTTYDILN
jgi:hypothetical protein